MALMLHLVVLASMWVRSGDGLSITGNLGIYTPLRQHTPCEENNVQLKKITYDIWKKEKRKTCEGKPVDPWVGMRRDGLKCPLRTSSLHASFDVLCGRCWGDFWCSNWPSSWRPHTSNIEVDLRMHGNGATKIAYPSSWPCKGQKFYW